MIEATVDKTRAHIFHDVTRVTMLVGAFHVSEVRLADVEKVWTETTLKKKSSGYKEVWNNHDIIALVR